jgi:23S rRNA U2552 (ribose-2'-O)-methylase RlmE/FtsJ
MSYKILYDIMNYYLLPINNNQILPEHIKFKFQKNAMNIRPIINLTTYDYIHNIKLHINECQEQWDNYKKYTNPYEYIHTVIPNLPFSICKLKPLSRSFYKMIEMCNSLYMFEHFKPNIKCFCLAEGPGGFIEALTMLRDNPEDYYYGMTLMNDNDTNIPGWKKSNHFLSKHKNIILENGADKTGNLLNPENMRFCLKTYQGQMDLITGDGGFDFSLDYNKQEILSSKLILAQIIYAIAMQKLNGNFILKIFDCFHKTSVDIIYLLNLLYNQVYVMKPSTSRVANSEKYIICKGFKLHNSTDLVEKLIYEFDHMKSDQIISGIMSINIPYFFTCRLEEYNCILAQQQIENISTTINLIENNFNERIENLKKNNIQKCIQWCQKNNLPYNKHNHHTNIFLSAKTTSTKKTTLNIEQKT